MIIKGVDYARFYAICKEIISDPAFKTMKKFIAHSNVSVYKHSIEVARYAYGLAIKKKIRCDVPSLVRGALLHDFFLYDWHEQPKFSFHGFKHARIALNNAEKIFRLNKIERNIIESHMFPLNLLHWPRCKEAWIVTFSDKRCALKETVKRKKRK